MATLKPLDHQYGLSIGGTLVIDRERNLAVENASIKNLQVTGTLTAVNSTDTYIKDSNISLNTGIEPGAITTPGTITGGSNYTPGDYKNVPLTVVSGTAGVGATADITVNASGAVSAVTIVNGGYGYATNTVLTAAAADLDSDATPNGTGFQVTVTAVSAGSASTDAFITVARGTTGTDVAIKWDETTTDRWQLTNNGTNYYSIYVTDDAATAATANKLVLRDGSGNITVNDIGAAAGTFSGDIAVNGGDVTTTATGATTLFNANTTDLSIGGAATALKLSNTTTSAVTVSIATAATGGASTLTFGGAVTGNTLKVASTAAGTVNVTTDVTTGIANIFTSLTTGTLNLATGGASTINLAGTAGSVNIGTTTGNSTLTIRGNGTTGTATLATNVTTGTVDIFTGVTTGSVNLATGGASTLNLTGTAGNVNIGTITGNSTLTIRGNGATGAATLSTNVTTGTANIFTSVTGTVNIGGVASIIYLGTQAAVEASTTTVATTSQTATDTFAAATFRSAEYLVQISQGSSYQISKILLTHDGTTAYITEYGTITSGASTLGTLDADISGGNVRLLVTMGSATSAIVKVSRTSIIV
jgi:fibronectin-binding autotransporter adhesin